MSAQVDGDCTVYRCVVCGPILQLDEGGTTLTLHNDIPHPLTMTFDEDDNPQ
jgi:hypothetical protein